MSKNSKGPAVRTLILGAAGALGLALLLPLGASASLSGGSMAVKAIDGGTGYAKVHGPAALTSAGSGSTTPIETAPPERHWGDFYSVSIGGLPASSYGKLATVETSDADGNTINLESNVRVSPTGVVTVSHSTYLSVHPDQLPLGVEVAVGGTSQRYSYQFHYGQENFIASTKTLELKGSIVNGAIVPEKPRR